MKFHFINEITDIGFMLRVFKPTGVSKYKLILDIQILSLNVWIELFHK